MSANDRADHADSTRASVKREIERRIVVQELKTTG